MARVATARVDREDLLRALFQVGTTRSLVVEGTLDHDHPARPLVVVGAELAVIVSTTDDEQWVTVPDNCAQITPLVRGGLPLAAA